MANRDLYLMFLLRPRRSQRDNEYLHNVLNRKI